MDYDPDISSTLLEYGNKHACSNPLADKEMRKLIDKAFHEDTIWDAAIDVLLNRLRTLTSEDYIRYFFSPAQIPKRLRAESKAATKAFWHTIWQHNISIERSKENVDKLRDRFEKRDKLLRGGRQADSVLDAAVEVLEQTGRPYTKWPKMPHIDTVSLQHNAEVSFLDELSTAVSNEKATATFACGGKVPIAVDQDTNRSGTIGDRRVSSPVDVRWDSTLSKGRVVRFPVAAGRSQKAFQHLLLDCQPATFGRDGEDVLDESYRKAGKLDANRFCTSFDPYECGI
ncbi:MAG: hypothetical protein Q9217_005855, partial [Psora testacea]